MITINLTKAKESIVHPARRTKRSEVFKPVDGDSEYATLNEAGEALRASIKTIDDQLQVDIDAAETEGELKALFIAIDSAYDNVSA